MATDGQSAPRCGRQHADVTTLLPVIDRLRQRFSIGRVLRRRRSRHDSAATIEGLEARKLEYILARASAPTPSCARSCWRMTLLRPSAAGAQRRARRSSSSTAHNRGQALHRLPQRGGGRKRPQGPRGDSSPRSDAQLKKGKGADPATPPNRRYLRKRAGTTDKTKGKDKDEGDRVFEIDAGKLAEEARFDGIFVLRTNANVTPLQARGVSLSRFASGRNLFLRTKAIMRTRPIFHSSDSAIRGHVFCSFLALVMQNISTIFPLRRASRRNGRYCCAISIVCNRCASSIAAPIGWCAPTRRLQPLRCSARPMSRCRREPDKPPRRSPRPQKIHPKTSRAAPRRSATALRISP